LTGELEAFVKDPSSRKEQLNLVKVMEWHMKNEKIVIFIPL
jgi:hypothetical protein